MTTKTVRRTDKRPTATAGGKRRKNATSSNETNTSTAIQDVLKEGRTQLRTAGKVDSVWIDDLTTVVVNAILTADSARVSEMERELNSFDADLRLHVHHEATLAQLALLRRISQLGAQNLAPQEAARSIEPNSHPARLLHLLATSKEEVFNDVVADELELHPTQLSHIFRKLTDKGLVERRKYGRRASWSLTPAGEITAEQLRERDTDTAPEELVTAATPEDFEDAVYSSAEAIEIDSPHGEDAWYVRATLDRLTGVEVFGAAHLPYVLFPRANDNAAYLRSDFARLLSHHLGSMQSGGLNITTALPMRNTDDDVELELEDV